MSLPLKQAIIRKNWLSLSKVMNNLVGACIAGNAKNTRNWPTLSRNFSATISIGPGSNKMFACNSYDYLGLVIDEKLSWTPHIEKVSKKISPIIAILKKIRYSVDLRTLEIIYNSFINSHLTYLLPIWGSASNTRLSS